jgi:hypothetical protein
MYRYIYVYIYLWIYVYIHIYMYMNLNIYINTSNLGAKRSHLSAEASFGSVQYQELILFRTETVMELLLLGFRPIIADIDAVWLRDPLTWLDIDKKINSNNSNEKTDTINDDYNKKSDENDKYHTHDDSIYRGGKDDMDDRNEVESRVIRYRGKLYR